MAAEYAKRIGRYCEFRMREVADDQVLLGLDRAYKIALDPGGKQLTSDELARLVERAANTSVHELAFLVGGPDGLSPATRRNADLLLSLSRLTLPHELARVILVEQIYRAFAILRNHPYAK